MSNERRPTIFGIGTIAAIGIACLFFASNQMQPKSVHISRQVVAGVSIEQIPSIAFVVSHREQLSLSDKQMNSLAAIRTTNEHQLLVLDRKLDSCRSEFQHTLDSNSLTSVTLQERGQPIQQFSLQRRQSVQQARAEAISVLSTVQRRKLDVLWRTHRQQQSDRAQAIAEARAL